MKMKAIPQISIFYMLIILLSSISCNEEKEMFTTRYSLFYKYEDFSYNDSLISEVVLRVIYEKWKDDSVLFITYNSAIYENPEKIYGMKLFQMIDTTESLSYFGYTLNFSKSGKEGGSYNLNKFGWLKMTSDSIPIYVFEYYPEQTEYDADGYVYYSPKYGILAEYSPVWDNLILLDSIFSQNEYLLNNIPKVLVMDSSIFVKQ